jgi:hypothetical protein
MTCLKFDGSNWVFVGSKGFSTCGNWVSIDFASDGTPYVCGGERARTNGVRWKVSVLNYNGSIWQNVGSVANTFLLIPVMFQNY